MRLVKLIGALWCVVAAMPVLAADFDAILTKHVPPDGPGVVAGVFRDGEEVYIGTRGYANIELQIPMARQHVLRIGSLTKQFTAAAVLHLAEAGKLKLSDHINQYVPDFPTHGHKVTLASLLNHTSGLNNCTNNELRVRTRFNDRVTLDEVVKECHPDPMLSAPGDAVHYSNTGYVLLGKVIEVASGRSYSEYLQRHFFKKLDMQSTFMETHAVIPNKVPGYSLADKQTVTADPIEMMWPHAAGALVSTVEDMAKWYFALVGGQVISADASRQMSSPGRLNSGEVVTLGGMPYGFGLAEVNIEGRKGMAHNGGINGFNSFAFFDPRTATYVVVLANTDSAINSSAIARDLLVAEQEH